MRFAEASWLWGMSLALVVALALAWGGLNHQRAVRRFGEPALVTGLKTAKTGTRRAVRAVLLVLALCLVFVAAAQPQYGRGTRLIPATNLDVVLVLDFSKSMYARDVTPSRIARAKAEVSELVRELGGARFGGVAFAGTPMSFPLTSDGAAVAQFFRGLEPNDMPVGGTAIARALDAARQLLERDPKSKKHERVAVLVTDGEDLEGDPVALAEAMARDRIAVHVVQIGGRSPEPIPEVDEHGQVRGLRQDGSGQLLTTSLSAEGEAQLAQVAAKGGGKLVRAEKGTTGVEEVARELRRMMTEELSEQVETVYADVYAYPLGLALLFLLLETVIGTAPHRKPPTPPAPPPSRRERRRRSSRKLASAATALLLGPSLLGCQRAEDTLDGIFQRYSPVVDEAIAALGDDRPEAALTRLTEYLETGSCEAGVIGTPERLGRLPDAAFDLGLAFFEATESAGSAGGAAGPPLAPGGMPGTTPAPQGASSAAQREQIDCALRVIAPVALDTSLPLELRARAHYLTGNLELLRNEHRAAVAAYDAALRLIPGLPETGPEGAPNDTIGRRAAHNRAVALRRLAEEPPEDQQSQNDPESDEQEQSSDQESSEENDEEKNDDSESDSDEEKSDDSQNPGDQDQDQNQDPGQEEQPEDASSDTPEPDDAPKKDPSNQEESAPQEPNGAGEEPTAPEQAASDPSRERDERLLDEFEQAPTFQQQDARQNARRVRGRFRMEDK